MLKIKSGGDIQDEFSALYSLVLKYVRLYIDGTVRGGRTERVFSLI